ncbi:hypothetical protein SEA_SATIS_248 [Streptomyces phage Satis]|nr:hypothetical protein SEA_SATIS_248 [Streptomyces phage Satis]QBZ72135.1 hypothetical protein SEA_KRADAL_249 [Streptomyces phage Kradal]QPL14556.1 hypothetical protein SEA_EHYELIMAYOE_251 [Streptomyces phage EhyElimayoE]
MASDIPQIQNPKNYLAVAQQSADLLNEQMVRQFNTAREEGYTLADLDVGTLAQLAQVNYLAAIVEGLKKLGA